MAGAIVPLMIAGVGVQAYGQYQQGKQAQAQAKAQAGWNLYNAKVAQREADAERIATAFDVKQQRRKADIITGRLEARRGASGVGIEGSPLLLAEDNAAEFAKEITNIKLKGQRRVSTLEGQSILDISKASAAKSAAAGFGRAAVIGAGSSILQGSANTFFTREQLKA